MINFDHSASDDEQRILSEMQRLEKEAPNWEDQLPFDVALNFHSDSEINTLYKEQVNECAYSQKLVDALNPTDEMTEEFAVYAATKTQNVVRDETYLGKLGVYIKKLVARPNYSLGRSAVFASLACLFLIYSAGFSSYALFDQFYSATAVPSVSAQQNVSVHKSDFPRNNDQILSFYSRNLSPLLQLESSKDAQARFEAAKIYLRLGKPNAAYEEIGRGLSINGAPIALVASVRKAAMASDDSDEELNRLRYSVRNIERLEKKRNKSKDELELLVKSYANLAMHSKAILTIEEYLRKVKGNSHIVREFSQALAADDRCEYVIC